MFDIGFVEIIVIGVVALLVVGPERLPGVARQAGLWVGKARRFINNVRSDIEREIQSEELKELLGKQQSEISELKNILKDTHNEVKAELEETDYLVKSIEDQIASKPQPSETAGDKAAPAASATTSPKNAD